MPVPRFRIRTLMIAVAVVAVAMLAMLLVWRRLTARGDGWSMEVVTPFGRLPPAP